MEHDIEMTCNRDMFASFRDSNSDILSSRVIPESVTLWLIV